MDNIIIRNRKEEFKELVLYTFFGNMTFVIRVLFRRNATWQGTISWKESENRSASAASWSFVPHGEAAVSGN